MPHYIEVVNAARETVEKIMTQRTRDAGFTATVTTNGGKTAAARRDGYRVSLDLPSLAPDTVLTRAEADRMVAYLIHEVCHMLHTDYGTWKQAVSEGHRIQHWTNALEDVRIEAHEMRVGPYKAMGSLLAGLVSHLYAEAHEALGARGMVLGHGMINAPYIVTVMGRAANGYDLPITRPLGSNLAPDVRKVVHHALAGLGACRSTMDCLELARELVALEQALQPGHQPGQQPQQGDQGNGDQGDREASQGDSDQGEGDQGDSQSDQGQGDQGEKAPGDALQGDGEGDQGQGEEAEGDQGAHGEGDQGEETGESGDQGAPGGESAGGGDSQKSEKQKEILPDLNLGKTAENIAKRTGDKGNGPFDNSHKLNSMACDRIKRREGTARDNKIAGDTLKGMMPTASVLHGQISRLLVSEARTAATHHETTGRLDRRALVRMKTGAPDVFTRRDYAPGIDTAVLVLVDLSGSMRHRIDLTRATVWALAQAAESAGGKLAIVGFKGSDQYCSLQYAKDWNQTANQSADALLNLLPDSYTPLSASIIAASQDLAAQTATRRIMLVLTDGQCDLGAGAVQSACRLAAAHGVEAVGIGMNCDTVIRAFPPRYSVNVEDITQLASTGLGVLTRMLEETGAR